MASKWYIVKGKVNRHPFTTELVIDKNDSDQWLIDLIASSLHVQSSAIEIIERKEMAND
jgi:hypothetical protein